LIVVWLSMLSHAAPADEQLRKTPRPCDPRRMGYDFYGADLKLSRAIFPFLLLGKVYFVARPPAGTV